MNSYIGVKLVQAESMTRGEYNKFRGWPMPENENPGDEGYFIKYSDDYVSWSPKDVFEEAYLKVTPNPKLKSGVSISADMVEKFVKETEITTIGDKTTFVRVTLVNGFEICETSACVDPENYDVRIGAEICIDKIRDKIWMLLGFLLQTGVGGVK